VKAFEEAARDAGRALGDCGAGEETPLAGEIARALADLAAEPRRRGAARRKSEIRSSKPGTRSKRE
jgi:hypothetical protein